MSQPRKRLFRFPWRTTAEISREVDTELAFHLEMRTADLVRSGMSQAEAERQAREEFGDLEFTRAYCQGLDQATEKRVRLADRLFELRQDLRQSWRTTRRSPGFAAVAILTLALAIGANTAIFSVIRAVLLRPLPYGDSESLVAVYERAPASGTLDAVSPTNLLEYRDRQREFADIGGFFSRSVTWRPADGDPELLQVLSVTANLFDVLQVSPILGRPFSEEDEAPGGEPRTILSFGFWQSALAGEPDVIGRVLVLNDLSYRIVGVMPRGFAIDGREVMWTPLGFTRTRQDPAAARRDHSIRAIGRLRPGATLPGAEADLARISRQLDQQFPASAGRRPSLLPLRYAVVGDIGTGLLLLQAASALLLLIACVNLANLALARGLGRRRELAVRAALGAGRFRLLRQLLAESILVSLAGGAVGILLAIGVTRMLLAVEPDALPALFAVHPDGTVLLFGLLLSLGTGVGFGLLPGIEAARTDLRQALQDGSRSAGSRGAERTRRVLVVVQVALAVMLLVGAGLLLRSFRELNRVDPGFDTDHVLTAEVRVSGERYDPAAMINGFYDRLLEEIRQGPGVIAVGATMKLPADGRISRPLLVEGGDATPDRLPEVGLVVVRGDYFQALHIPLVSGRVFGPQDGEGAPGAVIINREAARRYFPGADPLGQRLRVGSDRGESWSTIVGVVGDVREEGLDVPPGPTVYASHVQNTWWRSLTLTVRTAGDPAAAEGLIRSSLKSADPTLALRNVATLEATLGTRLAARRFALQLVSAFAAVALLLAAVGIYGVLAFSVTSRTREFGVRLALGARPRGVLLLVLGQGLRWSLTGLGFGLAGALAGGRLLQSRLYGITPSDTVTMLAVGLVLTSVAILACVIPARRATRVDPISSLRGD